MELAPGTKLGAYEITAQIGAGGMGEVYRARDTKLGREVAIKILPELFASDPERLARFEREARALASLNHANIAQIYGVEEFGTRGRSALVMELVEGEDLSARLLRGALPVADVLPIARQLADALESAHEHGIIHRDLKPANIKVRDDGTVKVLDFGLAKAMEPGGAAGGHATNSPTLTARATQLGLILGTAAYMSPEQARGKTVDRRVDIWAFGAVMAELLAGKRAFSGDDVTEVLAKVLERDPDLSTLPAKTPPSLQRLITRCLVKDPRQRLRDMGEARLAIEDAQRELVEGASQMSAAAAPLPVSLTRASAWSRWLPWGIAASLLAALVWAMSRAPQPRASATDGVIRVQIALPSDVELYTAVGAAISLAPDGKTLAFVGVRDGVRQVFLRRVDAFDVSPVKGTDAAVSCVFSLDGREILVGTSDTSLRRVRLTDGLVEVITPMTSEYYGGWLHDGRIVFTRDGRLWISGGAPGSSPTQLTKAQPGAPATESQPVAVPGTNAVLFVTGRSEAPDSGRIDVLNLDDMSTRTVVERATSPMLTASGHLLFVRDAGVLATTFNPRTLTAGSDAAPVLRDVQIVRNRGIGSIMAVSANGTLMYASSSSGESEIVSVSRTGGEQLMLKVPRKAANPRLSADGMRLLFEETGGGLWLYDLSRKTLSRLTDGSTLASFPVFTRDGREAVFRSPTAVYRQPIDGSGRPTAIPGTGPSEFPSGFSLDGSELIYQRLEAKSASDLLSVPLTGGKPRVLLSTSAYEGGAQLSPDGKWLLYVSNELGGSEVFIQPYPAMNHRQQVSSGDGRQPIWNPRGGEIFYRSANRVMAVRMTTSGGQAHLTSPVPLFSGRYAFGGGLTIPNFSITRDGNQFILVKEQAGAHLNVVFNWFQELSRVK
jgi:Tol biopolymer transport system component